MLMGLTRHYGLIIQISRKLSKKQVQDRNYINTCMLRSVNIYLVREEYVHYFVIMNMMNYLLKCNIFHSFHLALKTCTKY